jgi:hypothetical protein
MLIFVCLILILFVSSGDKIFQPLYIAMQDVFALWKSLRPHHP